jgi:hypothetical protein
MKQCCACLKEKTIDYFWKNKQIKSGYDNKCKVCKNSGKFCVVRRKKPKDKKNSVGRPARNNAPQLFNVKKSDWVETFLFLKEIGYDLSSDKSIHEQFCEKYNLKPRKRMYEKSIQYNPKDLGLF